jgi:ketosteroid isomerase-like protein
MNNTEVVTAFVEYANAFQVDRALALFADQAVVEDTSVGSTFEGREGVRRYLEQYFVGYHTQTSVVSLKDDGPRVVAQVDFIGDFGHETGGLRFTFEKRGLVSRVEAYLD